MRIRDLLANVRLAHWSLARHTHVEDQHLAIAQANRQKMRVLFIKVDRSHARFRVESVLGVAWVLQRETGNLATLIRQVLE